MKVLRVILIVSLEILDETEFNRVKEQKYFAEIAKNGLR